MTKPRVRLIGLPTDSHSSFMRGVAAAPPVIREALGSEHSNCVAENHLDIGIDVLFEDAGDLPLEENEGDFERIRCAVESTVREGVVPLCIGGDHMISFPAVAGVASVIGPVNILHFDAHPDLYDDYLGDPLSHASPFARIMENGHAVSLVQVGIRTLNRHCREQADRFGVKVIEMRDFRAAEVPIPRAPLYVSIDMDALDPSIAPGVTHYEPGGLTVRDILSVLRRIEGTIVGADIAEYHPARDVNGVTAAIAAKLARELASLTSTEAGFA